MALIEWESNRAKTRTAVQKQAAKSILTRVQADEVSFVFVRSGITS
jgi:hypothetical protein